MDKINIKYIVPDPNQPRKYFDAEKIGKLKRSVEKYGIINPLVVEKINDKEFLLVDGERRYKAALEVGLKEVPVNIQPKQDELERLIRQFHIQEQQEGWSATEKASVLDKLSNEMGLPMAKACELLGIGNRTGMRYIAFSKLTDKDLFIRSETPVEMAPHMISLREVARKISINEFEEKFTRTDDKKFEKAMIERIIDGEIKNIKQFAQLRDIFITDPKSLKKFMDTNTGIEKMFKETKAQSRHDLRNAVQNASFFQNNLSQYLKDMQVKPSVEEISVIKRAHKVTSEFLSRFQ